MSDPNIPQPHDPGPGPRYAPSQPPGEQGGQPYPPVGQPEGNGPGGPGGPPPTPEEPKKNTLGLVAMVMAIVGAVAGLIPGVSVLALILLPVSFILGIVSLFQSDDKKFGIIAIVVAVVGTILTALAFVFFVGSALDEAFETSETTVVEQSGDTEEIIEDEVEVDGAVGTRTNPAPLGSEVASDNWAVVVNSVNMDATEEVLAANQFNEISDGEVFVLVDLTATYLGEDAGQTFDVTVDFVSDSGEVYKSYDHNSVAPDPQFGHDELFEGGSSTGNIVFEVPAGTTGVLRVNPGFLSDPIFVATSGDTEVAEVENSNA